MSLAIRSKGAEIRACCFFCMQRPGRGSPYYLFCRPACPRCSDMHQRTTQLRKEFLIIYVRCGCMCPRLYFEHRFGRDSCPIWINREGNEVQKKKVYPFVSFFFYDYRLIGKATVPFLIPVTNLSSFYDCVFFSILFYCYHLISFFFVYFLFFYFFFHSLYVNICD